MTNHLHCLLLSLFIFYTALSGSVLLTPPFPPTAYVGQNYSLRFQATGLVRGTFSFEQLPPFFKGFSNGTISGTPQSTGSHKIIVRYADRTKNGSAEVVLSIAASNSDNVDLNPNAQTFSNSLFISFSDSRRVFKAGDSIQLGFQCINAVDPIAVGFNNLPSQLTADNSSIQGTISTTGLYTFSIVIGDGDGNRAQTFLTLNIQPKNANLSSALVDVPVFSPEYEIDAMALQASQTNAANSARNALQKAISAKNNVTMVQNSLYGSANDLVLAQQASLSYQQVYNDALQNLNSLKTFISNGAAAIKAINIRVSVYNSSLTQNNATLIQAQTNYDTALSSFIKYEQIFKNAVTTMAAASKASSEATTQYNQLNAAAISSRNAFAAATANLQVMKQNKVTAQAMLDNGNQVVPIAQMNVEMANQDNDAANANFNIAVTNVLITLNNTANIDSYVKQGRNALQQAREELGIAKFNLQLAQNKLFVAQAAKQASDKTIAIITAQGNAEISVDTPNKSSISSAVTSSVFRGCDNYAYPSMFGTATVVQLLQNGAKTSAGHKLAWGQCTKKSNVRIGDQIYYEGSLIQSTISLWLLVNKSI